MPLGSEEGAWVWTLGSMYTHLLFYQPAVWDLRAPGDLDYARPAVARRFVFFSVFSFLFFLRLETSPHLHFFCAGVLLGSSRKHWDKQIMTKRSLLAELNLLWSFHVALCSIKQQFTCINRFRFNGHSEQIVLWRGNDTFPGSLGCLYKPVDHLSKLFNAAGLWICLVMDSGQILPRQSGECDFKHSLECLISVPFDINEVITQAQESLS